MKKAKFMLVAVAAFAVVGGSLAFKAKTFNEKVLFITTVEGASCLESSDVISTIGAGTVEYYSTTAPEGVTSTICEPIQVSVTKPASDL